MRTYLVPALLAVTALLVLLVVDAGRQARASDGSPPDSSYGRAAFPPREKLLPSPAPSTLTISTEELPASTVSETFVVDEDMDDEDMIVAMAYAPDGRLFYTTKGGYGGPGIGQVRIVENGTLRETPFLSTPVNTNGEGGLLGIAVDPDFVTNRYVYIYKTTPASETGMGVDSNRVIRYEEDPTTQTAIAETATILLDVPRTPEDTEGSNHHGGNLHFGPDGKLYVTIGDYGVRENAQDLSKPMGKIHRLNPDGSIPTDNPFGMSSIWSYGHRNSFDFVFDPVSEQMLFTENGPECDDEVNWGQRGGNYGWPNECGETPVGTVAPLLRYERPVGLTGIDVYQGPIAEWHNDVFWCFIFDGLYHGTLDENRTEFVEVQQVVGAPGCTVDVQHGPDGALYLARENTISRIRAVTPSASPTPAETLAHLVYLPLLARSATAGW